MSASPLRILYAVVTITVLSMGVTNAEAQPPFRAFSFWFDLRQDPEQLGDVIIDTLKSGEGQAILSATAASFGIPPGWVTAAGLLAGSIRDQGEDHYIDIPFDTGFVFCNGRVAEEASHIGRGATSMRGFPNHLGIYAWLQQRRIGQGMSSIKVRVEVVTVQASLQQQYVQRGTCRAFETLIYDKEW